MYEKLLKALRVEPFEVESVGLAKVMNEAADAIEELNDNNVGKWIPVTERLPEENAPCIVYNKYYGPMVGWRVDGKRFRIPGSHFPDHPTHWMPLPQPPKESNQ